MQMSDHSWNDVPLLVRDIGEHSTRPHILIKSADFFERASDVDTLILDKTGTVITSAGGH